MELNFNPPESSIDIISTLASIGAIAADPKQCLVCHRPAFGHNFGVLTCDACKMFFRRVVTMNLKYTCQKSEQCYKDIKPPTQLTKCRACRYQKCIQIGMRLNAGPALLDVGASENLEVLIGNLMYMDSRRARLLVSNFTFEDPTLEELIESKKTILKARDPTYKMTSSDWCFFGVVTAVKFLMGLSFMKELDPADKCVLLQIYGAKASLLFSSLRSMREKKHVLTQPDGDDFFKKLSMFSFEFLNVVRSRLVNRLIELKITDEECILTSVILFCNPALSSLSEHSRRIVIRHQNEYSAALFKYCRINYGSNAPSRFTDLLSLCHVINKHYQDIQHLYLFVQFNVPNTQYKKLVETVIEK